MKPGTTTRRQLLAATSAGATAMLAQQSGWTAPDKALPLKPLYSKTRVRLRSVQNSPAPSAEIRALRRLTFGLKPGDLDYFMGLGNTFDQRLTQYVNEQINNYTPPTQNNISPNDPDLSTALNATDVVFHTLTDSLPTLWQERVINDPPWPERYYPLIETQRLAFVRACYSRWQIAEQLADFWHTHFSVYGNKHEVAPVFVHYDRDVIRTHMLGNFRAMLEAVTKSTAMMYYLDNVFNARWEPNENFAREIQELHTLGAVHSYGFNTPPAVQTISGSTVTLPSGLKNGYTEPDVQNLARALTGWSINNGQYNGQATRANNGTFLYDAFWHDEDPKEILGITLSSTGEQEVHEVLDLLAMHPNTARYVCSKLCRYWISDDPPASLVESAAKVFHNNWQTSDQLALVTQHILLSNEFKTANWGGKIKRPFVTVAGALRSCNLNFNFTNTTDDTSRHHQNSWGLQWMMQPTGHMPFTRETPDGFPDVQTAWLGGTSIVMTWRCLNWLLNVDWESSQSSTGNYVFRVDTVAATKADLAVNQRTAAQLVDYWIERVLGFTGNPAFSADRRSALIQFMQQDAPSPDTVLDLDLDEWHGESHKAYVQQRLQTMVASILMLPEFLLR